MGQFLYQIRPTRVEMLSEGPTEGEVKITEEHFKYLERLVEEGTVLMCGRTLTPDKDAFGIIVFEADSDSSAKAIMENDPAVRHNIMEATLFPYRVALWSKRGPSKGKK
jgi:uncharacterized protein